VKNVAASVAMNGNEVEVAVKNIIQGYVTVSIDGGD